MANHLVIGLGGTGGKILREFRKRITKNFAAMSPVADSTLITSTLIRRPLTLMSEKVGR